MRRQIDRLEAMVKMHEDQWRAGMIAGAHWIYSLCACDRDACLVAELALAQRFPKEFVFLRDTSGAAAPAVSQAALEGAAWILAVLVSERDCPGVADALRAAERHFGTDQIRAEVRMRRVSLPASFE